jgi:hypothetical protein
MFLTQLEVWCIQSAMLRHVAFPGFRSIISFEL